MKEKTFSFTPREAFCVLIDAAVEFCREFLVL